MSGTRDVTDCPTGQLVAAVATVRAAALEASSDPARRAAACALLDAVAAAVVAGVLRP